MRDYRARLAETLNRLGSLLINHKRAGEAEKPLTDAIGLWREVTRAAPPDAGYYRSQGMALGNLTVVCTKRGDLPAARQAIDEAVASHDRALAIAPKLPANREGAARELARLADVALRQGDHAAGVAAAERHLDLAANRPEALVKVASFYSRALGAVEKDATLPPERRAEPAQRYIDRAVACLRELKKTNSLLFVSTLNATDLAVLRARVDLKAALMDDAGKGGK